MADILQTSIEIPQGVSVSVAGLKVSCKGPKGEVVKTFRTKDAKVSVNGGKISLESSDKVLLNTIEAHLKNMCNGAKDGYSHKLKIIYSHFPMTLESKGGILMIKNFLGEKQPRKSGIVGATKIDVKGQEVTVSGPSKEDVGQTIANIKNATRIRKRDSRVFQDGMYKIE